jgi:hypothetical protein
MRANIFFRSRKASTAMLLAVMVSVICNAALAGRKTRLFTFEEGTPGSTTSMATNSITGPFKDVPDTVFGAPFDYYDVGPGGVPDGTPLGDFVATSYDPSPDFSLLGTGMPTYVNVADGSPLDSPAQGSNVGLRFNGTDGVLTSQGFRGNFIRDAAVVNDDPAVNGDPTTNPIANVSTSFTVLSQAWVRPDPEKQGTAQRVWSVGTELGGVRITPDGFWQMVNLGPPGDTVSSRPVAFGEWTHLAVLRTGGAGSLYVNGSVAATANGFFNTWPSEITLGSDSSQAEPFAGVVDNFSTVGTAGFGIVVSTDLDVFSDLGLATPSGIAGDVDQDGDADQADYDIWSTNAGFDSGFGQGDLTTLIRGDVDQNGKVNFFDFRIIAGAVAASGASLSLSNNSTPEPASAFLLIAGWIAMHLVRRRDSRAGET